jgi:hypothetical protein
VGKYGRTKQATDDNIIRHMGFACWITRATDTLRVCCPYCFCTATGYKNSPWYYVIRMLSVLFFSVTGLAAAQERFKMPLNRAYFSELCKFYDIFVITDRRRINENIYLINCLFMYQEVNLKDSVIAKL